MSVFVVVACVFLALGFDWAGGADLFCLCRVVLGGVGGVEYVAGLFVGAGGVVHPVLVF